jgi:hypothetical protein
MGTANLQQRLNDLFSYVRQGKIIEAMNEFYAKDTVMQENAHPPTKGLDANIEREKQFMSDVKELTGFTITASGVGDNVTFYESTSDFVTTSGVPGHVEQVRWPSGRTAKSCTSGSIMTRASTRRILFAREVHPIGSGEDSGAVVGSWRAGARVIACEARRK